MLGQGTVAGIAGVQFIRTLPAKADFDVIGHVFEEGMEEHDRDIGVLTVPRELREPFLKGGGLQQVLMMHQVVMSGDHLRCFPIGVVLAFCDGPTFRHGLLGPFCCLVGDGRHQTRIKPPERTIPTGTSAISRC